MKIKFLTISLFLLFSYESLCFSQNVWVKTNGPLIGSSSGSIYALTINAQNHVFAGVLGSGIYRSKDAGSTWQKLNNGISSTAVRDIVINNAGDIFVANSSRSNTVSRSTDNGNNWTDVLTNTLAYCLAITNNGVLFAGLQNKVIRSNDKGNTWSDVGVPSFQRIIDVAVNNTGYIFASVSRSSNEAVVFRSTDNGNSWLQIDDSPWFRININSTGYIFASKNGRIRRSSDNGNSWTMLSDYSVPVKQIIIKILNNFKIK